MKRSSTGDKQLFSNDEDRKGKDEESNRNRTPSAQAQILSPLASDILLGRGKPYQEHPGNVRFLRVIILYRDRYLRTQRREDKASIADEIVDLLKMDRNDPGRFLKRLESGEGGWVEVNNKIARDKVCHALRAKRGERKMGTQLLHPAVNYLSPDAGAQQRAPEYFLTSGSSTSTSSGGPLGSAVVEAETLLGSMCQSRRGQGGGLSSLNLISDQSFLLLAQSGMRQPENEPAAIFQRILNNRRQELVLSQQEDGAAEQEEILLQRVLVVLAQQQEGRPGGASLAHASLGATPSIDSQFPEGALWNNPLLTEEFVGHSLAAAQSMPLPPTVIAGGRSGISLASSEAFTRQQYDVELAQQLNRMRSASVSSSVASSRPGPSGLLSGYLLSLLQHPQSPVVCSQNKQANSSLRLAGMPPLYHPSTNAHLRPQVNWPFLPTTRTNQEQHVEPRQCIHESPLASIRQRTTATANAASSSTAEQANPAPR